MTDEFYMSYAISLAKNGIGKTGKNPLVGAVIVKDYEIIGEGYHEKYGKNHAEINALNNCIKSPEGATIYVTLEPCNHTGKTGPCTESIIKSGIKRVCIGIRDFNPMVNGSGIERLEKEGMEVECGILEKECYELNEKFFYSIRSKKPFVTMKYAMTMDGKIATKTGDSKWITSEKSRALVHKLRSESDVILVGINTVIKDNPMLNARIENAKNPIRIILDTDLKMPKDNNIINTAKEIKSIIVIREDYDKDTSYYSDKGCEIMRVPLINGLIDFQILMDILYERGILSVFIEGGGEINYSALKSSVVNKIISFISPKIIGGRDAISPVEGEGVEEIKEGIKLNIKRMEVIDTDVFIESEVINKCLQE